MSLRHVSFYAACAQVSLVASIGGCSSSSPAEKEPAASESESAAFAASEKSAPARVYRARPVVLSAGVYDANETTSCALFGGCVNGYMYFAAAPQPKVGSLPATYDGVERYDVNAWASNFQGTNRYPNESAKIQWEWSIDATEDTTAPRYLGRGECAVVRAGGHLCHEAIPGGASCANNCIFFDHDGSCECSTRLHMDNTGSGPAVVTTWGRRKLAQVSKRSYPLVWANEDVATPAAFTTKTLVIKEDDEGLGNDVVGQLTIDRRACDTDVFSHGSTAGWTAVHTFRGDGRADADKDIAFVDYKLWCTASP